MDKPLNFLPRLCRKPSKWVIIIVLAFTLPCLAIFIGALFYKHTIHYANKQLTLPKLTSLKTEDLTEDHGWTIVTTHTGDSLASIFKRVGLTQQILLAVLQKNPHANTLAHIKPDQQLQFLIRDHALDKLLLPTSPTQFLVVSRRGQRYISTVKTRKMSTHNDYATATVHGSLYSTAKRMSIPSKLIQQMTDIFNWDIDFAKDVKTGDQFTLVYQAYYIEDKLVNTGDILAVTYTHQGTQYQAIRHENTTGDYDYFNAQGASLKKAFSRYPIQFSHISSTYNLSRKHPILHYRRPHQGVDLAASIGTPIHATGDGRIAVIDRHNGYGNMIKIAHNKTYSSLYAHLLKFQKGLSRGDFVKRGQIIGYVGQTGLATGPHCHYEFHINQQPKNPTTVALPRASPVPAREMTSFRLKTGTLLAQLKLFEEAHLAAKGNRSTDTA